MNSSPAISTYYHVNYFTPATLREIARRAGVTTNYGPTDVNPTGDSLWGLLRAV